MNDTDGPEERAPQNGAVSRPGGEPSWVIEDVTAVRPSLMIDETATAQNIARVRREFATWLAVDLPVEAGDVGDAADGRLACECGVGPVVVVPV